PRNGTTLNNDVTTDDDAEALLHKISTADTETIGNTAEQLNTTTLTNSINALATARRVDVYGVGSSGLVAADLQQKLHRIGKTACAASDSHLMLSSAAGLGHGDVALAVSHTGTSTDPVNALRTAGRGGATTVAITNFPHPPISRVKIGRAP